MNKTKIIKHFNKRSDKYNITSWVDNTEMLNSVTKLINHCQPNNLLDLGIGTGIIEKKILKKIEIYGIDLSKKMLLICKKNLPKAKLKIGNLSKLTKYYKNNKFDLIFSRAVLGHLEINSVLTEAKSLLTPNGKILLCESISYNNFDCKNQLFFHNFIHKGHTEFPTTESFIQKFKDLNMKINYERVITTNNSLNRLFESINANDKKMHQIKNFLLKIKKTDNLWNIKITKNDIYYQQPWLLIMAQQYD